MVEEEYEPKLDENTKKDLIEIVDRKNWEYSIKEIIEWMEEKGYERVGKIIEDALSENILSVSAVDDDGIVWLELGLDGDVLWDGYFKGKEGFSEDE